MTRKWMKATIEDAGLGMDRLVTINDVHGKTWTFVSSLEYINDSEHAVQVYELHTGDTVIQVLPVALGFMLELPVATTEFLP